jgi:hypothetical protein
LFFHEYINNLNILFYRQTLQLGQLIRNASNLPIFSIGAFACIDEKFSGVIHIFVLANEEPRGAWKILAGIGFGGNSAPVSRLRRDRISGGNASPEFLRYLLDEVRMYFELNPDDQNY